jgi:lysophospholipid acyltransferase (LPLAT)-like uncharacterized protein
MERDPSPPSETPGLYQRTRSQRRLSRGRRLLYRVGLPIASALTTLFWRTYRIREVIGEAAFDAAIREHGALIPCYWHQHLMLCVPYLLGKRKEGIKLGFLISPSVDGEAPAMFARRLGGHVVRGSATNTGARALRDFYQAIAKEGISPMIASDGPHGPRYQFKSGALLLSQLSRKPVIPIAYAAKHCWRLHRTWDHFVLPRPFTRVVVAVGAPYQAPKILRPEELVQLQADMAAQLHNLYLQAAARLKTVG